MQRVMRGLLITTAVVIGVLGIRANGPMGVVVSSPPTDAGHVAERSPLVEHLLEIARDTSHDDLRSGALLARGSLVGRSGEGVAGDVILSIVPPAEYTNTLPAGTAYTRPVIGVARADRDGAFELRLDPGAIPANMIDENGTVHFDVKSTDGQDFAYYTFPSQPTDDGWLEPGTEVGVGADRRAPTVEERTPVIEMELSSSPQATDATVAPVDVGDTGP